MISNSWWKGMICDGKIVISLVFVNTYIASFELWSKRAIITWLPYILQMDAFTSSSRSFTSRFNPKHWKLNACSLHHACYLVQWGATYQNSRCVLNKSANDDWKLQLDITQTSVSLRNNKWAWHGPFFCIFLAWKPSK